jgi:adenosine kinase
MARILVTGTLAWDLIGAFDGTLGVETRNVKLESLHERFGGCAMNLAYSLRRLGHQPVPLVYVGDDYEPRYAAHVRRLGISEAGIIRVADLRCARGIICTGTDGSQFTAFYPGPTGTTRVAADITRLLRAQRFDAAILAPDLPAKTLACVSQLTATPVRVWCPGQYTEWLDAHRARAILAQVQLLIVNRQEWRSLRGYLLPEDLRTDLQVVITNGPRPVLMLPQRRRVTVPAPAQSGSLDPTGCGDAFAAALTAAFLAGQPLHAAVQAGIELAGHCLGHIGAQSH